MTLPLTGDLVFQDGFNVNGIERTPDGTGLLVVQTNTGLLFRVDPVTAPPPPSTSAAPCCPPVTASC